MKTWRPCCVTAVRAVGLGRRQAAPPCRRAPPLAPRRLGLWVVGDRTAAGPRAQLQSRRPGRAGIQGCPCSCVCAVPGAQLRGHWCSRGQATAATVQFQTSAPSHEQPRALPACTHRSTPASGLSGHWSRCGLCLWLSPSTGPSAHQQGRLSPPGRTLGWGARAHADTFKGASGEWAVLAVLAGQGDMLPLSGCLLPNLRPPCGGQRALPDAALGLGSRGCAASQVWNPGQGTAGTPGRAGACAPMGESLG